MLAGHRDDRPDGHARLAELDEQPAEADVTLPAVGRTGAQQCDEGVRAVRAAGPDLRAGNRPAAVHPRPRGPDRGEVGAGVRLGHTDGEVAGALGDGRQVSPLERLAAVPQQVRADLPVGDPVRRDRSPGGQEFLHHDVAFQRRTSLAAVLRRYRHADPATFGQTPAERLVPAREPGIAGRDEPARRPFGPQKLPDLRPELRSAGRQRPDRRQQRRAPHGPHLLRLWVHELLSEKTPLVRNLFINLLFCVGPGRFRRPVHRSGRDER